MYFRKFASPELHNIQGKIFYILNETFHGEEKWKRWGHKFLKGYSNNKQWLGVKSFLVYVIIYHLIKNNKKQ